MPDDNLKSTSSTLNSISTDRSGSNEVLRAIPPDHALQRDDWARRRLRMDGVILLFSGLLSYIVLTDRANAVDQLVVPSLIAGIVSLIAAYVFGAVWDYKSFMSSIATMSQNRDT